MIQLAESHSGGNPMGEGQWVRRSLRHLSADLRDQGHAACPNTVRRLLDQQDFSMRGNVKRLSGPPHPDREAQFQYIRQQREVFAKAGAPILSVDAKKKELIGNFKNAGRRWVRQPDEVNTYDFPQDASCKATPYGLYDVQRNRGLVCVGTSADTAEFAVDGVDAWMHSEASASYGPVRRMLILADGGGSNAYRSRLWKRQLQNLSDRAGVAITVCHYPRGASKWNPVERRLFGPISINWAGVPLRSLDVMLGCIRDTSNRSGLRVEAKWIEKIYATKIKITKKEFKTLSIQHHATCPKWNYTIRPRTAPGLL